MTFGNEVFKIGNLDNTNKLVCTDKQFEFESVKINQEYARLLPELSRIGYQLLKASIRVEGLHLPIVVNQYGTILDGHNRYNICQELQLQPKFTVKQFKEPLEEKQFVVQVNLIRRHLNDFQIAELGYKLKPILAELAKKRQIELASTRRNKTLAAQMSEEGGGAEEVMRTLSSHESKVDKKIGTDEKSTGRVKDIIANKIGLSPSTYYRAEKIIENAPEHIKEKLRKGGTTINKVYNQIQREEERQIISNTKSSIALPERGVELLHGSFLECSKVIPDNSIDLIFTDPPYDEKSLPIYNDLAALARRALKNGGSLVTYAGTYAIQEIMDMMRSVDLKYWWTIAVILEGSFARHYSRQVTIKWKPLLWFVKGSKINTPDFVSDIIYSTRPSKTSHKWEQSIIEAKHIISRLTVENQVVLDPMMGSGTTGIAALNLIRRFIGIELEEETFWSATDCISQCQYYKDQLVLTQQNQNL